MELVISSNAHSLSSNTNTAVLKLYDLLPKKRDVKSMAFIGGSPEGLKSITVTIGGQAITQIREFDTDDFLLHDFCGHGLKMSRTSFLHTDLRFEFDRRFLEDREEHEMVPEMRDIIQYGEECEVYDGYEYYWGNRVTRNSEPTGRLVRNVTKGVLVRIPDIKCVLSDETDASDASDASTYAVFPVWHDVIVNPAENTYLQRLRDNFGLTLADAKYPDLDAAIASNEPFTARVQNKIWYHNNMAGACVAHSREFNGQKTYTFIASKIENGRDL
jgi:hypothetical protein